MCGGKLCGKYTHYCVVWGEKPNMHSKCVAEKRDALGRTTHIHVGHRGATYEYVDGKYVEDV